jgi:hypothetical protein
MGFDFEKKLVNRCGWDCVKAALTHYKNIHGHLQVPYLFVIPENEGSGWPAGTPGMKLGHVCKSIRVGLSYCSHVTELREMGFDMNLTEKYVHHGWDRIKAALLHYKQLYATLNIPRHFSVPEAGHRDAHLWPENVRGMKLS